MLIAGSMWLEDDKVHHQAACQLEYRWHVAELLRYRKWRDECQRVQILATRIVPLYHYKLVSLSI